MASNKIFTTLGASNHTKEEREENDFYATDPISIDALFKVEEFGDLIWEPACGMGHLSERIKLHGKEVISTDLIERGYEDAITPIDFLTCNLMELLEMETFDGDIITNPPYKCGLEFIRRALDIIPEGRKVAVFMKIQFLEGQKRKRFYAENPFKVIHVFSYRVLCAKDGDFDLMKEKGGSAAGYAWYVWEKGYKGKSYINWI